MKATKRIISMILAMVMASMVCLSGFSETVGASETGILNVAKRFIESVGYDVEDCIIISEPVALYEVDDTGNTAVQDVCYYYILDGNTLIGLMNETQMEGESVYGYFSLTDSVADEVYTVNSDLAVVMYEGATYLAVDNELILMYKGDDYTYTGELVSVNLNGIAEVVAEGQTVSLISLNSRATDTVVYSRTLNVPIVANAENPVTQGGLCWAACVAMQYNYRTGNNLQARTVWSVLYAEYGPTPVGSLEWYQRAYEMYSMPNMTYLECGLSSSEVAQCLNTNKPIQISLDNRTNGHAVIISGMTVYSDGSGIYYINDPNASAVYLQSVSSTAMSNYSAFVYANYPLYGTSPWTNWDLSIY